MSSIQFPAGATVLVAPNRLDEVSSCAFSEHAFQVLNVGRLVIDLRNITWVEPFGTLVLACAFRKVIQHRRSKGLKTQLFPDPRSHTLFGALGYLRAFGFFDYISRDKEAYKAPLKGGESYLPISRVSLNRIESDQEPVQESVERYSERMAAILFPESAGAQIMLAYSLREIIRNAFEHAGVEDCVVMAQRWAQEAEIAVADAGAGIHETISPVHRTQDASESIRLALEPGIRGTSINVDTGRYENTGFGLYVVSELGARYGEFAVQSSERVLVRKRDREERWIKSRAIGTCVKLRVNLEDGEYFPNILLRIVGEGERRARSVPGAIARASGASKSPQLVKANGTEK